MPESGRACMEPSSRVIVTGTRLRVGTVGGRSVLAREVLIQVADGGTRARELLDPAYGEGICPTSVARARDIASTAATDA